MEGQSHTTPVVDPGHLTNVLIDLQVGIRRASLYSISHPIIPKIVACLASRFDTLFEFVDNITLGIAKDEMLYQGNPIAKNNPVIRELARMLNQLDLVAITFKKGLTGDDVLSFLKIISENRVHSVQDRERMISQFQEDTISILLQRISFKDAVKGRDEYSPPPLADEAEQKNGDGTIWKGLVNRLMGEGIPEGARTALKTEMNATFDPVQLAKVINMLCKEHQSTPGTYEREIVKYLQEQTNREGVNTQRRIQANREIGTLLSSLRPEVREQIFRLSLENPDDNDKIGLKELVDVMPPTMLLEVLNQIQVSEQTISSPMFTLLNKLTSLSATDSHLKKQLESKTEGQKDLFEELFVNRADRLFYPTTYRAMLDEEFALDTSSRTDQNEHKALTLDDAETNYHLALVLLELLEGPIIAKEHYEGAVDYINQLLIEGLGDQTQFMLMETLKVLLTQRSSKSDENASFFRAQIKKFLTPDIVSCLLQSRHETNAESDDTLLTHIIEATGHEIIPVLLGILEVEERLSARKRILELISNYGGVAVPMVVEHLYNTKWYVVRNMLVLLRDLHAKEAIPHIAHCATHTSSKVRVAALQALGAVGANTDEFFQGLEHSLVDEDPKVFKTGVSMLLSSNTYRAVDMVNALLTNTERKSDSMQRRITVVKAISNTGTKEWIPSLQSLRKQLLLRFWSWGYNRSLRKTVSKALSEVTARGK